jgi:lipopolysaccharide heptosyltransferase II
VIVVRVANWLGDTIMALPALRALRAARPAARITLVGRWAPLLSGQAVADVAVAYPRRLAERRRLGRCFREDPPDVALLLPNSFESALAAWWWRARRRIGFDTDARRRLLTDAVVRASPRRHQVDEYGTLLAPLDIHVGDGVAPTWRLAPSAELRRELDSLLKTAGVPAEGRIIGLHLGAAFGASKLWPAESLGQLSTRLRGAGFTPLLLGSTDDGARAEAVAAAADAPVPSLVGRDRPALLPSLLSRLSCLVSGDTGVAHLGAALGVPTVTLFGPTDPRLTAPLGASARVLYRAVPCSPCFLPSCPIDHRCLRRIGVDEVERQVREALGA